MAHTADDTRTSNHEKVSDNESSSHHAGEAGAEFDAFSPHTSPQTNNKPNHKKASTTRNNANAEEAYKGDSEDSPPLRDLLLKSHSDSEAEAMSDHLQQYTHPGHSKRKLKKGRYNKQTTAVRNTSVLDMLTANSSPATSDALFSSSSSSSSSAIPPRKSSLKKPKSPTDTSPPLETDGSSPKTLKFSLEPNKEISPSEDNNHLPHLSSSSASSSSSANSSSSTNSSSSASDSKLTTKPIHSYSEDDDSDDEINELPSPSTLPKFHSRTKRPRPLTRHIEDPVNNGNSSPDTTPQSSLSSLSTHGKQQEITLFWDPRWAITEKDYRDWVRKLKGALIHARHKANHLGVNTDPAEDLLNLVSAYEKIIAKLDDEEQQRADRSVMDDCNIIIAAYNALTLCNEPNHEKYVNHFRLLLTHKIISAVPCALDQVVFKELPERGEGSFWWGMGHSICALFSAALSALAAIFTHGASLKTECAITATVGIGAAGTLTGAGFALFFGSKAISAFRGPALPSIKLEGMDAHDKLENKDVVTSLKTINFRK